MKSKQNKRSLNFLSAHFLPVSYNHSNFLPHSRQSLLTQKLRDSPDPTGISRPELKLARHKAHLANLIGLYFDRNPKYVIENLPEHFEMLVPRVALVGLVGRSE